MNAKKPALRVAQNSLTSAKVLQNHIRNSRNAILSEFAPGLGYHSHHLRLALNEAEALAWQTDFPHLVFPMLAVEKAEAVAFWRAQQERVHEAERHTMPAAA
jgi:hypothetical protein